MALLNKMGWIIGAPSKRRIKGRLSVTKTAFPTSSAATIAVKKPLNSTPCSCRIRRLVNRIRLKPTKKKIIGGSACFTCASHQVTARRRSGVGVAAAIAGWLICYSPTIAPSYPAVVTTEVPEADGMNFIDAGRGTGLREATILERRQPHRSRSDRRFQMAGAFETPLS